MALILVLETATPYCSVAISEHGETIALMESTGQNDHASLLALFIRDIFQKTCHTLNDIDAVAVSKGPGSYTGLRIGVSTAKGLCYSLEKPLLGLSTLDGMAWGMIQNVNNNELSDEGTLFCPMIDARRMEVYCAVYDRNMKKVRDISAEIVDEHSFEEFFTDHRMVFFGDGAEKILPVLGHMPGIKVVGGFHPSAGHYSQLAQRQYDDGLFEDVAYFEPYYLKEFIAGKPRVKGL